VWILVCPLSPDSVALGNGADAWTVVPHGYNERKYYDCSLFWGISRVLSRDPQFGFWVLDFAVVTLFLF